MASTPPNKDSSTLNYMDGPQSTPAMETDEKAPAQPSERRWSSRPSEHRLVGFLPTAFVMTITLVFVTAIVAFLLGTQYAPVQGGRGFKAAIDHKYFVLSGGVARLQEVTYGS